jgi:alginate O-acetyltransferase complex protein AlgJ
MSLNKFKAFLITFLFLIALCLPMLNEGFSFIKDIKSSEKRRLTKKPKFDINKLDPFPKEFEAYFNDNYFLRFTLIRNFNIIKIKHFKQSPLPEKVIIGKNGWLFMGGLENDAFLGKNKLTPYQLQLIQRELENRKKYYEDSGIKFFFIIAPTKATIYSEYYSYNIKDVETISWGKQLVNHLSKKSKVNCINLYEEFNKLKKHHPLYYKTDNHWTEIGAFYTSNLLLKFMKKDFKGLVDQNIYDYEIIKKAKINGNISAMLSISNLFKDIEYTLEPKNGFKAVIGEKFPHKCIDDFPYCWDYEQVKTNKNSNNKKLLIITDSFGEYLFPFIAENFSKTIKIFDAWQYKKNEQIVAIEKPDAIVLLILESSIKNLLPKEK